jgi:hypothetical protein
MLRMFLFLDGEDFAMPVLMSERIRLVLLVDDDLRAALRLEAAKRDVDMSDIVAELLRENLAESLAEVRRRREGKKKGKE